MNSNEQGLKGLKLKNILECLFFVASEPLSTKQSGDETIAPKSFAVNIDFPVNCTSLFNYNYSKPHLQNNHI